MIFTLEPSFAKAKASSQLIGPPPIKVILFGIFSKLKIFSLVRIFPCGIFKLSNFFGELPVAITHFLKEILYSSPVQYIVQ